MRFYPTIATILKGKGRSLLKVNRSYRSVLSHMFYFLVALIVVIGINWVFVGYTHHIRWLSIVPILFFLNIFRTYYNDIAHLERHKITQYYGRLALNYEVPSLKYTDVRSINVTQDIFGRLFDYGDLELGSAGAQGYEMIIHGVRAPRELAYLINDLRSTSFKLQADEHATAATAPLVASNE